MNKTIPYTYLIGWPDLNMWYYGVRYAQGCCPEDLWNSYFTSSKYVDNFVIENGNPPLIKIRKIFTNVKDAQDWEHRVLKRLKVTQRNNFLNKTDNKSITPAYGNNNPATRSDVKTKISNSVKIVAKRGDDHPRRKNPEKWTHQSALFKGRKNYWQVGELNPAKRPEVREKLKGNKNAVGSTHSQDQKDKWSIDRSGIPKPTVCCLSCKATVGINIFPRWHGENCKTLNTTITGDDNGKKTDKRTKTRR